MLFNYIVKLLNSGHLRVLQNFSVVERLNILFAIHGMSAIWDARYWGVSLYNL